MCDFSLYSIRSRPAQVADKLVTHNFGTGTRGFAAVDDLNLAVCLMPGTELASPDDSRKRNWKITYLSFFRKGYRCMAGNICSIATIL